MYCTLRNVVLRKCVYTTVYYQLVVHCSVYTTVYYQLKLVKKFSFRLMLAKGHHQRTKNAIKTIVRWGIAKSIFRSTFLKIVTDIVAARTFNCFVPTSARENLSGGHCNGHHFQLLCAHLCRKIQVRTLWRLPLLTGLRPPLQEKFKVADIVRLTLLTALCPPLQDNF